ncbi:RNA chaperone Hfq [Salibacterium lacus]|uniref:RNA-binding protein Hfq n=1 Tax=Salibacterium lacus TaxID=1898109 RepID=A0ABW5SYB3_9BACI
MKQPVNIQDQFLNTLRREKIPVTVFLLNGFQLRGHVKAFDNFTVVLDSDGKQQLIYKHAISTFAPQRHISLQVEAESADSATEK